MSQIICCHIEYLEHPEARYSYFGQVHIDRHDTLLAVLGGGPRAGQFPVPFALRGFPADANLFTNIAWFVLVSDRENSLRRTISRATADEWASSGVAEYVGKDHITDPDYFGPSWLETQELGQINAEYLAHVERGSATMEALLGAMRPLPGARLVYWFGN